MRIAIILIAVLLLAGGGGGWWYYDNYMSEDAGVEMAAPDLAEEITYEYVELTPVHLPLIDARGVQQMVSIVIVLEVPDKLTADRIKQQEPKLVNAYLTHMYGNMNNNTIMKNGVLQVEAVRQRMDKITRHILEDEDVHEVLLQMINQRRV